MDYQVVVDINRLSVSDVLFITLDNILIDDNWKLLRTISVISKWLFDKEKNEYLPQEFAMQYLLDCSIEEITEYLEEIIRYNEVSDLVNGLIK